MVGKLMIEGALTLLMFFFALVGVQHWLDLRGKKRQDALERGEEIFWRKVERSYAQSKNGLTHLVYWSLLDNGIANPETASRKVAAALGRVPNWQRSEADLYEVRKEVTAELILGEADTEKVNTAVEALFALLQRNLGP